MRYMRHWRITTRLALKIASVQKATALDWLSTHVREEDGLEWNYSINNLE